MGNLFAVLPACPMSVDCGDNCWPWHYESLLHWLTEQHLSSLYWFVSYLLAKGFVRLTLGGPDSWDKVSLAHNILSVVFGFIALTEWDYESDRSCGSLSAPVARVLLLQMVHCITDALVYFDEMVREPVFIFHHGILFMVACVQPHCPGCSYLVCAYTIAEFGSATIAVDTEWRKSGGRSRGFSRMALFGTSRVINLYLLYKLWHITPSTVNFMILNEGQEVVEVNMPVCMLTNLGGSLMMMAVNGLTWYRMLKTYLRFRKKRKATGDDLGPCGLPKRKPIAKVAKKSRNSRFSNQHED